MSEEWLTQDIMPKLNGETYRCECGCNVYRYNKEKTKLKCNSCNAVYSIERNTGKSIYR